MIAEAMRDKRDGLAKVFNIICHLRWGVGDAKTSLIQTRGKCLESTSANCHKGALASAHPQLSVDFTLANVLPYVHRVFFLLGSDRCSGVTRAVDELKLQIQPHVGAHLLELYCAVHGPADRNKELLKAHKTYRLCHSLSRLLQSSYYYNEWVHARSLAAATICRASVKRFRWAHVAARAARCSQWLDRVLRLTVFRPWRVQARFHPLSPHPVQLGEADKDVLAAAEGLKEYWYINPDNFRQVVCYAKASSGLSNREYFIKMITSYVHLAKYVTPSDKVTESRWEGHHSTLACTAFAFLVAMVGVLAWRVRWKGRGAGALQAHDWGFEDFHSETSARLGWVTRSFESDSLMYSACFLCAVTIPVDRVLRYIEAHEGDSKKSGSGVSVSVV